MNQFEKNETDLEGGKLLKDGDKATRGNKVVKSQNQALLAGLAYCISSCSMILVNKFVLSSYNFDAGISLMLYQVITLLILFISSGVCICFPPDDIKRGFFFFLYSILFNQTISDYLSRSNYLMVLIWMQNLVSVIIVSVLSFLGIISTEPLTWRLVKVWLPVNVIFVGMLITSMFRYEVDRVFPI